MNGLLVASIGPAATNGRQQIQIAHNPKDRFGVHQLPGLALDPAPDAADTVGLPALLLALHNQIDQPLILGFLALPVPPCIVSAAAYLEYLAHGFDAVFPTESFNDPILQLHLLPASDRKFRSKSTVILS